MLIFIIRLVQVIHRRQHRQRLLRLKRLFKPFFFVSKEKTVIYRKKYDEDFD